MQQRWLSFRSFIRIIGSAVLIAALSACPPRKPPAPPTPPPPNYFTHVVKYPGETLSIIASWYTGQGRNWQVLVEHNPGINPKRIRIGDIVHIPMDLVVKKSPLPKNFGNRSTKPKEDESLDSQTSEPPPSDVTEPETSGFDTEPPPMPDSPPVEPTIETVPPPDVPANEPPVAEEPTPEPPQVFPTIAPEQGTKPVPREQIKIKTRDELLKELLEE